MNVTHSFAYINWRMSIDDRASNYESMAEGYKTASMRLLDSLLIDNSAHDADAVIFPILFCVHQSIELYLKAAIIKILPYAKDCNLWKAKFPNTHDLTKLVSSLNSSIPDNNGNRLIRSEQTSSFFNLVDFLQSIGADGESSYYPDFARYPESIRKDEPVKYRFVEDESLVFSLVNVKALVVNGLKFIEGYCAIWSD